MLWIMKDCLRCPQPFLAFAEWTASVGIPVDMGKITAGDKDTNAMAHFKNMTRVHQFYCELVNTAGIQQRRLGFGVAVPGSYHSG